jgi:hypothetical protein
LICAIARLSIRRWRWHAGSIEQLAKKWPTGTLASWRRRSRLKERSSGRINPHDVRIDQGSADPNNVAVQRERSENWNKMMI